MTEIITDSGLPLDAYWDSERKRSGIVSPSRRVSSIKPTRYSVARSQLDRKGIDGKGKRRRMQRLRGTTTK